MNKLQRHKTLKKLIRKYISLRLVNENKPRKSWDDYPNGNCNLLMRRITIKYSPHHSLDWIDSLIIHEMGHFIAFSKFGFKHHPVVKPKRVIEEEVVAWDQGEQWIKPNNSNLIPKRFEWIKNYCLDTYRFTMEQNERN